MVKQTINGPSVTNSNFSNHVMFDETLKILHVGKFYSPHRGGIESHLNVLCSELRKSMDLRVIVANDTPNMENELVNGVPVLRLANRLTLASTSFCPDMAAKIKAAKADLIHIHLPNPAAVLAYLASGYKGRVIFSYHSDVIRQKYLNALFRPIQQLALRRSSAIIVGSPQLQRSSDLAVFRDRCRVIPYGLPVEQFAQADTSKVNCFRQRYGSRLVLTVGRLVYYKGLQFAIRAMTLVRGTLLIVGVGPLRASLQALASELGVADRVIFLGELSDDDLRICYHASDVFALSSIARSEAFGIVQIEALAAGKPVINTQLDTGVPFVSLNGVTGLTVPPSDHIALAAAINRLLDDHELQVSYGRAARLRASTEFSVEAMSSRTLQLYQEVMSQPLGVPVSPILEQTVICR
jgi:glycosyltransferase involved in cell wall biosynthesis